MLPTDLPFSIASTTAYRYAEEEAKRLGHSRIQTGHLLLGIASARQAGVPGKAAQLLDALGFSMSYATTIFENRSGLGESFNGVKILHDHQLQRVLENAETIAKKGGREFIDTLDLLEALATGEPNEAQHLLNRTISFDPNCIRAPYDFVGKETAPNTLGKTISPLSRQQHQQF